LSIGGVRESLRGCRGFLREASAFCGGREQWTVETFRANPARGLVNTLAFHRYCSIKLIPTRTALVSRSCHEDVPTEHGLRSAQRSKARCQYTHITQQGAEPTHR